MRSPASAPSPPRSSSPRSALDMTRFPTAAHLASWAKFAPGVKESAGKKKGNGSTGHGNRYLARVLGEAAVGAARTDTFLGERYRRIARRRGNKKAIVAVGRSILVIVWHLLSDPDARFHDLGPDFYDQPHQPRTPQAQPHPPARSPRLQGHPRTRRLTSSQHPSPAPLRSAGRCRAPTHAPIFGLGPLNWASPQRSGAAVGSHDVRCRWVRRSGAGVPVSIGASALGIGKLARYPLPSRHISRCARYPFVQSKRLGARQSMSSLWTFQ